MKNNLLNWLNASRFLDLNVLQWAVPLFLAVTAVAFEFVEHGLESESYFELAFLSEVIIFGLMGPVILAFIIAWMRELVKADRQAAGEIQKLNRRLEQKVETRTAELAERNRELAQANRELQQLDEMKSEFVSLVSHELRAPLTTLNGGLELALQSANSLPAQARRILESMVGESLRLTELVQRILDVSRLEAGKLAINLGPVAVRPLMEAAAEVILTPRNRLLEWKFAENLPPVWADEIHLEEIVRNLMRNAEKYSPPDSIILPVRLSGWGTGTHLCQELRTGHPAGRPAIHLRTFWAWTRPRRRKCSARLGFGIVFRPQTHPGTGRIDWGHQPHLEGRQSARSGVLPARPGGNFQRGVKCGIHPVD